MGEGRTIHDAQSMEDYGNSIEDQLAQWAETKDWRRVHPKTLLDRPNAVTFLDAEGFRFYLPALMTIIIQNPDMDGWLVDSVIYNLNVDSKGKIDKVLFRSLFSVHQKAAIVRFLKYMIHHRRGFGSSNDEKILKRVQTRTLSWCRTTGSAGASLSQRGIMTNMIHIDGSHGEGGGQIVRTSLALSLVTGQPVVIENIRAGRQKPGLMRQHLTSVNAATRIGNAMVSGAEMGSRSLTFAPQQIVSGDYHFSIGTAGSTTLVLQTILPALIIASGPSTVTLEGGTHNQWAPPFDFLQKAFLPLINRMGPKVSVELERHGFYPAGGGRFTVSIEPSPNLNGFDLLERGELKSRSAIAVVSNLPRHIAQRETDAILHKMNWNASCARVEEVTAHGPGNVVSTQLEYEHVTEVITGFGRIGASAENVAKEVIRDTRNYLKSDVPVGEYLADQILLPFGISAWQNGSHQRGGSFLTMPLTRHSTTHIELLRQILGIEISVANNEEHPQSTVTLGPMARTL